MAGRGRASTSGWVLRELRDIVPQWFATLFLGQTALVALRLSPATDAIQAVPKGFTGPTALLTHERIALTAPVELPKSVIVEIPSEFCLPRKIEIPARAASQLAAVAALDLARKTPFRPEDVHVALSAAEKNGADLVATQWVIRREDIDRLSRNLQALGTTVRGVRIAGMLTTPALLADFSHQGGSRARVWRQTNAMLVSVAILALAVGWLFPVVQAARALPQLEARRQLAQETALALRSDIEARRGAAGEEADFLAQVLRRQHLATALRELTVALEDGVWLADLSYTRSGLTLSGETANSAAALLIGLTESRTFENPRLSGSVSRSGTGHERFEIAVDFRRPE